MCGITGFLDLENGVNTRVLRAMNDVIRHRGPDDEGYALIGQAGPAFFGGPDTDSSLTLSPLGDGRSAFLGFGHRRLSILDLSAAGHQPMSRPERQLTVTYNGEIYNYLELRTQLEALGHKFHTSCDTEVLLHAYAQWGENCLSRFNGMWGFALWDGEKRRLFCARDRLGAKPFHYWLQGNRMLFGSELKQLCQDDSVPRRFDRSYLAANLIYHISDYNDQTLIENFHSLRPGHKLTVQLSDDFARIESAQVSAYWSLEPQIDTNLSADAWREQVHAAFSDSVKLRLRSDAPLSSLLSGGLDSSCLTAEICGQLGDPAALQTFTTSYPGHADCDEWNFANMVNQACGCRGCQYLPDPTDGIEKKFEQVVWHTEGISGLAMLGVQEILREVRRQGYRVVLNGQCGDETMFGYERYYAYYFADLLRRGHLAQMLREFRQASRHSKLSTRLLAEYYAYFNFPAVRDGHQLHRAGDFVRSEVLEARNTEELHTLLYPRTLQQLQKTELTATQLTHICRFDDRLYMGASLESRIPFMDYRFVELAVRIPPELKIAGGYTKNLMREIYDSRLPKEVVWRTNKMGFGAPVGDWAKTFSREYLTEQVRTAKTAPLFRTDVLQRAAETAAPEVFEFLQIEQFARQFGVS